MFKEKREIIITKLITPPLPLYEKQFPIIFFYSPKSGCTSLTKWFFFQIGLLQKAIDYDPSSFHQYRGGVFQTQENYKIEIVEQLLGEKKDVYKLVRNPYNRAVSSFFTTLKNEWIMNQVAPEFHSGLSFKQFLYQVMKIGATKDLIDVHIAQQYVEGEEIFIQSYVHLEHFNTSIREIEKKYNLLESPIPNIIHSSHHMAPKMRDMGKTFADVNMSLKTLNKPLPDYKNFYDGETRDLVREIFNKDFENYGYNHNDLN